MRPLCPRRDQEYLLWSGTDPGAVDDDLIAVFQPETVASEEVAQPEPAHEHPADRTYRGP